LLLGEIDGKSGDIGFVDDYTAWVVGTTAEGNTARIQAEIIPRVTKWERESGATFEADKTLFIHFTRARTHAQRPFLPLIMDGKHITAAPSCKFLGVHLDKQLRMRNHVQKAAQKALVQAAALNSLRGLSPQAMRQLYLSTVVSQLDYAAAVWFQPQDQTTHRIVNSVQRMEARAITGAFKTASTSILEIEAGLLPATCRLWQRMMQHLINLHTLGKEHPWWRVKLRHHIAIHTFRSPLMKFLDQYQPIITSEDKLPTPMETIKPFVQAPASYDGNQIHYRKR
jgi:hypothetical protein